jgi:phosphoribosylanthranilate isomerase
VTIRDAAQLGARNAGRSRLVGLFVDADDATIAEAVTAARLDVLQLHGQETPARAAQLRAQFGLPVWKALSVAGPDDISGATRYAGAADLLLFDAKAPKGAALPGAWAWYSTGRCSRPGAGQPPGAWPEAWGRTTWPTPCDRPGPNWSMSRRAWKARRA